MIAKRFLIPLLASFLLLLSIFIATMLTHYRGIDVPYLLYGVVVIAVISSIACVISGSVFRGNRLLASLLSVFLSVAMVCAIVISRS